LVGPAKLNPAFIKRINEDMNKVMAMPDVIEKFDLYGAEDGGGSPERFAEFIRNETQKWAKVIKDAKVQADS
jgi:tripartite-type tricarboxylate transporter receptor subunit TctC